VKKSAFDKSVGNLVARIKEMPSEQQEPLFKLVMETCEHYEQVKKSADRAKNALDDLRLMLKYSLFNAEATKREKDATSGS